MTEEELLAQFPRELQAFAESTERIDLMIRPADAWIILACMQLALRHPNVSDTMRECATDIGHRLEELIANYGPALKEMARRGWDPAYDQTHDY